MHRKTKQFVMTWQRNETFSINLKFASYENKLHMMIDTIQETNLRRKEKEENEISAIKENKK